MSRELIVNAAGNVLKKFIVAEFEAKFQTVPSAFALDELALHFREMFDHALTSFETAKVFPPSERADAFRRVMSSLDEFVRQARAKVPLDVCRTNFEQAVADLLQPSLF